MKEPLDKTDGLDAVVGVWYFLIIKFGVLLAMYMILSVLKHARCDVAMQVTPCASDLKAGLYATCFFFLSFACQCITSHY